MPVAGHRVEIRGHAVLVDGELRPVPPAGMSLLRALARKPGWVVSARNCCAPSRRGPRRTRGGDGDGPPAHRPGRPKLIQTVVKRGYRLALDPAADTKYDAAV